GEVRLAGPVAHVLPPRYMARAISSSARAPIALHPHKPTKCWELGPRFFSFFFGRKMMSWRSFKPLLAVAVSLLAMAALVPAASADPITYIDGTNGQFTLTSNGTTATITFVDNNVTQLNHQLVPNKMTLFATMSI